MILYFLVQRGADAPHRVTVACAPSTDAVGAAALLRSKLSIPHDVTIALQTENGTAISKPSVPLSALTKRRGGEPPRSQSLTLIATLSGPAESIRAAALARFPWRTNDDNSAAVNRTTTNPPPSAAASRYACDADREASGTAAVPAAPAAAAAAAAAEPCRADGGGLRDVEDFSSPSHSDEDDEEAEPAVVLVGIHTIKVNGVYDRGYARNDTPHGGEILREVPIVTVAYPMQLVEAVRGNERLRTRSYDAAVCVASTISGLDDETYSKYLSIAQTHGSPAHVDGRYGEKMALFPELCSIRHSCEPNSMVQRHVQQRPFYASCRATAWRGMTAGDEVVVLYPRLDCLGFLLLSHERRQELVKRTYFFDCRCRRCSRSPATDPVEKTLSGAFYNVAADAPTRARLAEAMRRSFDALDLLAPGGVPRVGIVTRELQQMAAQPRDTLLHLRQRTERQLQFIRAYSGREAALQLHDQHWRLSVARAAYIHDTAKLAKLHDASRASALAHSPSAGGRPFQVPKVVFDLALKQLRVEGVILPEGHPHLLHTYRAFQLLQTCLSDNQARLVQRAAVNARNVKWDMLRLMEKWKRLGWPDTL